MLIGIGRANRSRFAPSGRTKVVVDGNSIYADHGELARMASILSGLPPLAGSNAVIADFSICGQSWAMMDADARDVDAAYDPSRYNILICGETTNSAGNEGKSARQIYADASRYLANRLARHPDWHVVLCSGLPRDGAATAANAAIAGCDELMRHGFRDIGAKVFVDYRTGDSPFCHDGTSADVFRSQQALWQEQTGWLHPTLMGKRIMAQMLAHALYRLPPA